MTWYDWAFACCGLQMQLWQAARWLLVAACKQKVGLYHSHRYTDTLKHVKNNVWSALPSSSNGVIWNLSSRCLIFLASSSLWFAFISDVTKLSILFRQVNLGASSKSAGNCSSHTANTDTTPLTKWNDNISVLLSWGWLVTVEALDFPGTACTYHPLSLMPAVVKVFYHTHFIGLLY